MVSVNEGDRLRRTRVLGGKSVPIITQRDRDIAEKGILRENVHKGTLTADELEAAQRIAKGEVTRADGQPIESDYWDRLVEKINDDSPGSGRVRIF